MKIRAWRRILADYFDQIRFFEAHLNMKIAYYIADLLFEHECIVIPGLGGFISKEHPASVHPVKHQFKPPYKEIVFNPHLRANDGMLLNFIAQQEQLSYGDAKQKLDRFVLKCLEELGNGRRITFRNIGFIQYDEHRQIIFQADENQNYLGSSFGLSGFVSPAIKREGFQERLEKTIQQQREEKQRPITNTEPKAVNSRTAGFKKIDTKKTVVKASARPNRYKKQLAFIGILVLLLLIGWGYMNKPTFDRYYDAYAGWIPLFYASPNEYVAHHLDKIPVDRIINTETNISPEVATASVIPQPIKAEDNLSLSESYAEPIIVNPTEAQLEDDYTNENSIEQPVKESDQISTHDSEPITEESMIDTAPESYHSTVEVSSSASVSQNLPQQEYHYFIIAGAFRDKGNADKLVNQLRQKGFNAMYAGQTNSGLWRIAFEAFADRSTALRRLDAIKQEENSGAWLFSM